MQSITKVRSMKWNFTKFLIDGDKNQTSSRTFGKAVLPRSNNKYY
jgi:glutathione peroxidase-family protein